MDMMWTHWRHFPQYARTRARACVRNPTDFDNWASMHLVLGADGAAVFQHVAHTTFIIAVRLLDVPPAISGERWCCLPLVVVPGPKEPTMTRGYLAPLCADLRTLQSGMPATSSHLGFRVARAGAGGVAGRRAARGRVRRAADAAGVPPRSHRRRPGAHFDVQRVRNELPPRGVPVLRHRRAPETPRSVSTGTSKRRRGTPLGVQMGRTRLR
ncbi:unnamed protein product [Pedinophyceae sp. YPF-701]|nr:unnamed protein product [Pedinophyceae sp. YPF-701]